MRYPGGKGRTFQLLINLMPPHRVYIETHLGGGAVMRAKRPAERNIGVDLDPAVGEAWRALGRKDVEMVTGDAVDFLTSFTFRGDELVYSDPPYWPAVRRRAKCYRHDYGAKDHQKLLEVLVQLPCKVVLSGYPCDFYDGMLKGWHRTEYMAGTHLGLVPECAWTNYEPGPVLHDYTYIGEDFRSREAVRRRRETHLRRLMEAEPIERLAVLADLAEAVPHEVIATAARLAR